MPTVLLYTTAACPYCDAAKQLLKSLGVTWHEVRVDLEPHRRAEMMARTHRRTVPQIYIGERHVGGFDDLVAARQRGELTAWLAES